MRILIVTSHDIINDHSGTPKHIQKISQRLAQLGHKILIIHLNRNIRSSKVTDLQNYSVHELPPQQWILSAYHLTKNFSPSACIAFTSGAAVRFLPVLSVLKTPLVYEVHTVFKNSPLIDPVPFIYEQLEKLVCRRANHLIVLGEQVKEIYSEYRKIDPQQISVIYPAVDVNEFVSQNSCEESDEPFNVTYLGNLIYENHGINYLFDAARIVCSLNKNIEFTFAGEPDGAETHYAKITEPISGQIHFNYLKDSSEVGRVMSNADIFTHTRIYSKDNLSVQSKLAVYLACGKPVVATNFADYQFLIQERGCGFAVDLDPTKIANAILTLAKDPTLRSQMGKCSRETALTYMDLDTNVKKYETILASIELNEC
jgi:glycosyltransferase involved in cell wall biosynthesis